jgi:hypothetical protein
VIDLGADFRLNDKDEYQKWYGLEHTQDNLLSSAVYGLCEINREQIKNAALIANPGCYPTAIQLALKPLIDNKLIDLPHIIADCKSGVSGAGRGANQANLLCEVSESFKAYGVGGQSITLIPFSMNAPAPSIATPCGVAKNITSHSSKVASSGKEKTKSHCPAKEGKNSSTRCPASERELTTITSAFGWLRNKRNNSMPV